jgi:hypothetical protein
MNLTSVLEGDGLRVFVDALKKNQDESAMEDLLDES